MSSEKDTELEDFSKNLQNCMKRRNLNQTALAEKTGISQAAVSRYLKALACPGGRELRAMANALGVSMDFLWCGKDYTNSEVVAAPSTQAEKELAELKRSLRIVFRAMSEPENFNS